MNDDRWELVAGEDDWDQVLAAKLDGATVLVGLTHRVLDGEERREQFFGTVMAVDPGDGVTLRLEGERAGEIVTLPPLLEGFKKLKQASIACRRQERKSSTRTIRRVGL